jgi:hypothetical protein
MEEHGKVFADAAKSFGDELVGGRADDDPVAFRDGQTEQRIADGAADLVYVHRRIIP